MFTLSQFLCACGLDFINSSDTRRYSQTSRLRIGIIGAGVSGIAAAAHIAELGHDCCIFEAGSEDCLGGVWTKTNKSSGLQISSEFYRPHPSVHWKSEYPDRDEILREVRALWQRFGLAKKTKFGCPVERLIRVDCQWSINDGADGLFDGIIAAIGTCGQARPYSVPGQQQYSGTLIHSTQLDDVEVNGRSVGVIGGGASAVEAMEYCHDKGASKVKVISRSEKWIIPRWRPVNTVLAGALSGPSMLWSWLVGELLRWLFYGSECSHIAPPRKSKRHVYSSTPIVNSRVLNIIRSGGADWVKGDVEYFEPDGLLVRRRDVRSKQPPSTSRSLERCDVVVQATGFERPTLHFLEPYQGNHQPPNWWLQVFPPGEPTLCALNSTWQEAFGSVGGGQIGLLTRLLLVFLLDPSTQPTRASMESWVAFMVRWNGGLKFITHIEIYLWLTVVIACNWKLWPWATFVMAGGDMPSIPSRDR